MTRDVKNKSVFKEVFFLTVFILHSNFAFNRPFRSAFELWGHGQTDGELRTSLLNYPPQSMVCENALTLIKIRSYLKCLKSVC